MKREEKLSLNEFATAPKKAAAPRPVVQVTERRAPDVVKPATASSEAVESGDGQGAQTEARKALRRLKRERMKGVQNFVNVHLDRETKRRLKLASFNEEVSMQTMMEAAIRKFLDDNGH